MNGHFKELKSAQETLRRESEELASLNALTESMEQCDDIFAHVIANQVRFYKLSCHELRGDVTKVCFKDIQKLAYGALQNQVQERISTDEKRIENVLVARRDTMKIKFNMRIENMMFSIALSSGETNQLMQKIQELWRLQQESCGKFMIK